METKLAMNAYGSTVKASQVLGLMEGVCHTIPGLYPRHFNLKRKKNAGWGDRTLVRHLLHKHSIRVQIPCMHQLGTAAQTYTQQRRETEGSLVRAGGQCRQNSKLHSVTEPLKKRQGRQQLRKKPDVNLRSPCCLTWASIQRCVCVCVYTHTPIIIQKICTEEFLSCVSHKPHPKDTLMTTSFVPQRWGLPPDLIL